MENKKIHIIDLEIVKSHMISKDISEKELAKQMGVTLQTVKRFLSGADQRRLPCTILAKLAKALNVTAQSLIHKDYL